MTVADFPEIFRGSQCFYLFIYLFHFQRKADDKKVMRASNPAKVAAPYRKNNQIRAILTLFYCSVIREQGDGKTHHQFILHTRLSTTRMNPNKLCVFRHRSNRRSRPKMFAFAQRRGQKKSRVRLVRWKLIEHFSEPFLKPK